MIALQIHITAGPQAGTRFQLTQSPASFGRAPENTLVLDLSTISRTHGELRFEEGQWWLHNLSQNGTKAGRKRVTKKPRALSDGASIVIGDEEVFRIHYAGETAPPPTAAAPATAGTAQTQEQPDQPAPGTGARGRSKLWLLGGIWFALCIGIFVLLYTTIGQDDGNGGRSRGKIVQFQSAADVRQILKRPPTRETPDEYRHNQNLDDARSAFDRLPRKKHLYDTYRYYRNAMRYMPASDDLGPVDQQRYEDVLDELAELIFDRYEQASTLVELRANEEALAEIDELLSYFPASTYEDPAEEELHSMIMRLRSKAAQGRGRR